LNDARRATAPHWLASIALGLGISATLTVNVMSGLAHSVVGAALETAAVPDASPPLMQSV
jgi:hypothetical protein